MEPALLVSALSSPEHTLFRDVEPAGQMQRLDSAMVEYYLLLASKEEDDKPRLESVRKAVAIGVRMLFEDDYVIGEVALLALKALIGKTMACSSGDLGDEDPSDVRTTLAVSVSADDFRIYCFVVRWQGLDKS